MTEFANRAGLHARFFEPVKVGHFGIEAPIDRVTELVAGSTDFLRVPDRGRVEVRRDTLARVEPADPWPIMTVFQLEGLAWTQVVTDLRRVKPLPLGRHVSGSLDSRVVAAEITDDLYYSHAVFDGGAVKELQLDATKADVRNALEALGLAVPSDFAVDGNDEWDDFDEADFNWRDGAVVEAGRDLGAVVEELGGYLHFPSLPAAAELHLVEVEPSDVVRLDTIWVR